MAYDPEILAHRTWLGFLQPVGLVVSPPALVKAQAVLNRNMVEQQQRLVGLLRAQTTPEEAADGTFGIADLPEFLIDVLGWQPEDLLGAPGAPPLPAELEFVLPEAGETLRPTYAVPDPGAQGRWLMLVEVVPRGLPLDRAASGDDARHWQASPQARFERLLRETGVPAGLLCNGTCLRLVYAPRGETSGHLTFPIQAMTEVAGRPIVAALELLLSEHRVFSAPDGRRLGDLLKESRKYQSEVSTRLAEQVLDALWELLRGFESANGASGGQLLAEIAREDPQHLYGGLLTTLLRLVFLLYAEDQGLMSADPIYQQGYSVAGLYQRLRTDAGRYPDTMDQRYGAWTWLVSLFRLVFDGGAHGDLHLPARQGELFNPDSYPFLEGRPLGSVRVVGDRFEPPRVPDGCVHRVLDRLLVLDGERLSYRSLDVEQIGSVYEAIMGFAVEQARGPSVAVRPQHVVVDLAQLLAQKPTARHAWLKEQAACELSGAALEALKQAGDPDEVLAALGRKASPRTPRVLSPGGLYLQPGEERRRSGSHYTPRELTGPIVRTTLRPVLEALGEAATPEQILALKLCDPAMGSGAFLVEACRQLADRLVQAWQRHGQTPKLPPDEDPLLHARRLVATRCLYGVDKNPFAVNLAKLSLWLVTLAKDHPFTFLDHALKCGDSLVGLTRAQIAAFTWKAVGTETGPLFGEVRTALAAARHHREDIQALGDQDERGKKEHWWQAEAALADARLVGDLVIAAFFGADKDRARESRRRELRALVDDWKHGQAERRVLEEVVEELRMGQDGRPGVAPFHWEIEFPEVFGRERAGFECVVGNPPFLGGTMISTAQCEAYKEWLYAAYERAGNRMDLVAYFFRRAFSELCEEGCLGLIGTNTVGQGDTREGGLRFLCTHGGTIYDAKRRLKWPGAAAVVVSVVHVRRTSRQMDCMIDGRPRDRVTAFLFHRGGHDSPQSMLQNHRLSFEGSKIYGQGFLFDDGDDDANPSSVMHELIEENSSYHCVIRPYIGGEEVNSSPVQQHNRHVIDLGTMTEEEARYHWPALLRLVEEKVKPERARKAKDVAAWPWWQFWRPRSELYAAVRSLPRIIAIARVGQHAAFAILPTGKVYSEQLVVFPLSTNAAFCALQSRPHEVWARFFASSLEERLRYTPSDCFETFPFPPNWQSAPTLEAAGQAYYEFRAALMIRNDEGLTKTYNRFHSPDERHPDILELRRLHAAMDRAVLDAYGWTDIPTDCEFLLDYEIDEETWGTKKKPYRYRWPEAVHDEVLARLLALNQQRAEEERLAGAAAAAKEAEQAKRQGTQPARGQPKKQTGGGTGLLF